MTDRPGDAHGAFGGVSGWGRENLLRGQVRDERHAGLGDKPGGAPDMSRRQCDRQVGAFTLVAQGAKLLRIQAGTALLERLQMRVPSGDGAVLGWNPTTGRVFLSAPGGLFRASVLPGFAIACC